MTETQQHNLAILSAIYVIEQAERNGELWITPELRKTINDASRLDGISPVRTAIEVLEEYNCRKNRT